MVQYNALYQEKEALDASHKAQGAELAEAYKATTKALNTLSNSRAQAPAPAASKSTKLPNLPVFTGSLDPRIDD